MCYSLQLGIGVAKTHLCICEKEAASSDERDKQKIFVNNFMRVRVFYKIERKGN